MTQILIMEQKFKIYIRKKGGFMDLEKLSPDCFNFLKNSLIYLFKPCKTSNDIKQTLQKINNRLNFDKDTFKSFCNLIKEEYFKGQVFDITFNNWVCLIGESHNYYFEKYDNGL